MYVPLEWVIPRYYVRTFRFVFSFTSRMRGPAFLFDTGLNRYLVWHIFLTWKCILSGAWLAVEREERQFFCNFDRFFQQLCIILHVQTLTFSYCNIFRVHFLSIESSEKVSVIRLKVHQNFRKNILHCLLEPRFVVIAPLCSAISTTSRQGLQP